MDDNDQLASFSNYGRTSVDLAAPGVDITSTAPGNSYQTLSGTSPWHADRLQRLRAYS